MITSNATHVEITLTENYAGPNPRGSHLSALERLHLLCLIARMNQGGTGPDGQAARDEILEQLKGRQFTPEQLAEVFQKSRTPIEAANALCVHPSMRIGESSYLD